MEFITQLVPDQPLPIVLLFAVAVMIYRGDLVPRAVVKQKDDFIATLLESNQKLLRTAEATDKLLITINKTAGDNDDDAIEA